MKRLTVLILVSLAACVSPQTPQSVRQAGEQCAQGAARLKAEGATVYDAVTRLTWRRCPAGQLFSLAVQRCEGGVYAAERWSSAKGAADTMRNRERAAWRLPSSQELTEMARVSCNFHRSLFDGRSEPIWTGSAAPGGKAFQYDASVRTLQAVDPDDAPGIVMLVRD
jgi:hypothetical protein